MGILKKIEYFLLGKEKIIKDPFFGEIISEKIKKEREDKNYRWYVEDYLIPNKEEETTFINLEGNYRFPNPQHLETLKKILNNLPDFFNKIKLEVERLNETKLEGEKLYIKKWTDEYYFSGISSFFEKEMEFAFYLDVIDYENENLKDITFDYIKGEVKNLEF